MRVAIVGGIGTGKSAVMKILESLGANTIYTDKLNKELLEDKEYISLISSTFSNVVYNNKIDKGALRNLIINDEVSRLKLNSIAHPRIIDKINDLTAQEGLYFVEIPLLKAVANMIKFDKICFVTACDEVRQQRIVLRDKVSLDDAKKIIQSQQAEKEVALIADYVVVNDGDLESLRIQVTKMFEQCLIG